MDKAGMATATEQELWDALLELGVSNLLTDLPLPGGDAEVLWQCFPCPTGSWHLKIIEIPPGIVIPGGFSAVPVQ